MARVALDLLLDRVLDLARAVKHGREIEAREQPHELRYGKRAHVRGIAETLDLVVELRLRPVFRGDLIGDQETRARARDAHHLAEHDIGIGKVMKRRAAGDHIEVSAAQAGG